MCSSLCSVLSQQMAIDEASILAQYILQLTPNASQCITVSKASAFMKTDIDKAYKMLVAATKAGVLKVEYALRCPECGMLIKRLSSIESVTEEQQTCYDCQTEFLPDLDNIEVLFALINNSFFPIGQLEKEVTSSRQVAQCDTLMGLLCSGQDLNHLLYSPSEEKYDDLKIKLMQLDTAKTTTKQIGDAMEDLFMSILKSVAFFRASSLKTETNQIDCYVRNTLVPFFPYLGERIIVECKNEKKKPDNTYYYKITGIIDGLNGNHNHIVKLGIIVSYQPPAKTVKRLATLRYARDNLVVISFDLTDLKSLVNDRANLLEMIERKRDEIATNAVSDLKEIGVFTS